MTEQSADIRYMPVGGSELMLSVSGLSTVVVAMSQSLLQH